MKKSRAIDLLGHQNGREKTVGTDYRKLDVTPHELQFLIDTDLIGCHNLLNNCESR
jgi:hypothetical protein